MTPTARVGMSNLVKDQGFPGVPMLNLVSASAGLHTGCILQVHTPAHDARRAAPPRSGPIAAGCWALPGKAAVLPVVGRRSISDRRATSRVDADRIAGRRAGGIVVAEGQLNSPSSRTRAVSARSRARSSSFTRRSKKRERHISAYWLMRPGSRDSRGGRVLTKSAMRAWENEV